MSRTIRSEGQAALIALLTDARKAAGLTQAELAGRLHCHQSMIARIESGQRRIDVAELVILARALDIDPAEIVTRLAAIVPPDARI